MDNWPVATRRLLWLLAVAVGLCLSADVSAAQKTTTSAPAQKKLSLKPTKQAAPADQSRVRRLRLSRSRAAAQRALKEAQEPRFRLDETGALVPDVRAEAAIVYDAENGRVLFESHSQDQRSIASITKIMTAVVFLEDAPDLNEQVVIARSDARNASTTYVRTGYSLTKADLLHLLLMASDNAAARALARVSSFGPDGFISRMNEKALELGLTSTRYADPSWLLSANVSSAYDMARLIAHVSSDQRIAAIMQKPYYTFAVGRREINIHSTNQLVKVILP